MQLRRRLSVVLTRPQLWELGLRQPGKFFAVGDRFQLSPTVSIVKLSGNGQWSLETVDIDATDLMAFIEKLII